MTQIDDLRPIRFMNVLLPEPEGPMTAQNSPALIFIVTSRSTGIRAAPDLYVFSTPINANIPDLGTVRATRARNSSDCQTSPIWLLRELVEVAGG